MVSMVVKYQGCLKIRYRNCDSSFMNLESWYRIVATKWGRMCLGWTCWNIWVLSPELWSKYQRWSYYRLFTFKNADSHSTGDFWNVTKKGRKSACYSMASARGHLPVMFENIENTCRDRKWECSVRVVSVARFYIHNIMHAGVFSLFQMKPNSQNAQVFSKWINIERKCSVYIKWEFEPYNYLFK